MHFHWYYFWSSHFITETPTVFEIQTLGISKRDTLIILFVTLEFMISIKKINSLIWEVFKMLSQFWIISWIFYKEGNNQKLKKMSNNWNDNIIENKRKIVFYYKFQCTWSTFICFCFQVYKKTFPQNEFLFNIIFSASITIVSKIVSLSHV